VVNPGDNILVQVAIHEFSARSAWFLDETTETYISELFSQPASSQGAQPMQATPLSGFWSGPGERNGYDSVDLAATGSSAVVPEYWDTADGGIGGVWELPGLDHSGTIYLVDMICTP